MARGGTVKALLIVGGVIAGAVALVAAALLVVGLLSASSSSSRAPATTKPDRPPPHPSGASPEDVEALRWLQGPGAKLRREMSSACGDLDACTRRPPHSVACIDREMYDCAGAIALVKVADIPKPFEAAYEDLTGQYQDIRCQAAAAKTLLQAEPRARSVDSLGMWASNAADDNEAAARYRRESKDCASQTETSGGYSGEWSSITDWLRERFSCGPQLGCCTPERVEELAERGQEPGPPDPSC